MILSTRSKEAIKIGLAVVVAYAISLYLGWEKPFWSAFSVLFISMDTAGASLNKAALRMSGTLVGGAAAFFLLVLFPQQRWLMVASLSVYYGFCVYMMTGSKRPYFWFVCTFVCMVVMVDVAPAVSLRFFQIVVARVEETGMGILVYSLISVFLWPRSSRGALYQIVGTLSATQHQLYRTYRGWMTGQAATEASQPLRMKQISLLTALAKTLSAAESDSYEVSELRRQWRRLHADAAALMEALEQWRESIPEVRSLDLKKLLPNLEALGVELETRFAQIEVMLADEPPTRTPEPVRLAVDPDALKTLTHFQKAVLAVTKTQLDRVETLSRSLFDCVQDIKGFSAQKEPSRRSERQSQGPVFDLDRLTGALLVTAAQLMGFLIWIYVDPPGHALFVFLMAQWALLAVMTRTNPSVLLPGLVLGLALGGIVYVFVMPHLSGFLELSLMLFTVTFGAFYLLRGGVVSASMAFFHVVIGIQNQQTYSFAGYANTSAALLLSFGCVIALFYAFSSPRPEKVFLRLLRRYFHQAEVLMLRLALDRDEQKGLATRWQMALYRNDLLELPSKLAALGQRIDQRLLPGQTAEQVQALTTSLQAMAYRIKELVDARELPQNDILVAPVTDELRAWRLLAQQQFRLWADSPAQTVVPAVEIRDRLAVRISKMEDKIESTPRGTKEGQLKEGDYENFYRYLGALRGLSQAALYYLKRAQSIDWEVWKEARF